MISLGISFAYVRFIDFAPSNLERKLFANYDTLSASPDINSMKHIGLRIQGRFLSDKSTSTIKKPALNRDM